ncbi:MAG: glycosyltransferase family 9 protein [Candidatus Brocadiia bacterium]
MRIFGGGFRLDEAKKILIVRNDRIGDVVLTLPMATAIRRRFPQAEVHFLLRRYTAPLAAGHPDVGKVVVVPDSLKDRAAYDRCLREIRTEKYDLAIVVHSKGDVARLVRDAKIPFRMGSGLRLHSWRYNVPVFQRRRQPKRHELDYNLDMIRGYVPVPAREEVEFRLRPDEKALLRVRRFLDERKIARYTIVHPGSGQSAVDLPLETFGKLMDAFEFPGEIIVTGTSDESALYRGLAAAAKRRLLDATGAFSLSELVALISGCDLFLSNSTGPLHIARALNRRLLGFYCTVPACHPMRWGPYAQEKSNTVLPPGESYETFQPDKKLSAEGMKKIRVETIVERLKAILSAAGSGFPHSRE